MRRQIPEIVLMLPVLSAGAIPAVVWSQQTQQEALEEVVVTGSRIAAADPNLVTSSPVTMVTSEELGFRGINRVEDLINDLPSIVPELTANESNGATGSATIDLRGLSSERTLVLTNGHRMGFGNVFALAPDINQVPGALIERVEVLTGGASATYGSDAISGVVNFIMKKDFEGIQVDYQYAGYHHDSGNEAVQSAVADSGFEQAPDSVFDGSGHDVNIIFGIDTPGRRGNITGYLGYRETNALTQSERDFSACTLSGRGGGDTCAGSATIPTGLFTPFDDTFYYTVEGNKFVPWDSTLYNYGPPNHFQRPDERYTAGLFGNYELNERLEGYVEFQFMDDSTNAQIAPSGAFFVTSTLNCSNAFLSAQQFAAIGCASPADVVPLYIGRRNVEGGFRKHDITHTSYRGLGGIKGNINDTWSYDAHVNISRTDYDAMYNNDLSITRITRALDVVEVAGAPTCRSVIDGSDPGCVPWNVFQTGGVTQEALDYLRIALRATGSLEQDQYVAFISGDLTGYGVVSPLAQDGVQVVLGGEYRDEKMDFRPDMGFRTGDGAGQGGPTEAVSGDIDVAEFFVEARVPLVEYRLWFQSLTVDVGYRYSDYSRGVSTDTYRAFTEWTPVESLKLRGGYSRAVRAANIRELFEPSNLGLWSGVDPCAGPTPIQTPAQCANSGVTAEQYGKIPLSPAGQYNAIFGGNIELTPEKANTFTVGAVMTPEDLIPGLTVSVDYWHIEILDAIDDVEPEFIVNQCGLTGDPVFCAQVNRGSNGNLWIGSSATAPNIVSTNINIGFFETSGVDFFGNYSMEAGNYGAVEFTFRGTWLEKFEQQLTPGAVIEDCAGQYGSTCTRPRPEWRHNLGAIWTSPWNLTFAGSWRHVSGVDEFANDRFSAGSENYIDMSVEYTPGFTGIGETTLSVGVSNLMDNDPPVSGFFNNVAVFGNGNTIPGMWDTLGRYLFFGVSQKF